MPDSMWISGATVAAAAALLLAIVAVRRSRPRVAVVAQLLRPLSKPPFLQITAVNRGNPGAVVEPGHVVLRSNMTAGNIPDSPATMSSKNYEPPWRLVSGSGSPLLGHAHVVWQCDLKDTKIEYDLAHPYTRTDRGVVEVMVAGRLRKVPLRYVEARWRFKTFKKI